MDQLITTQREIPPSRLERFLNIFRRWFGLPTFEGTTVIETTRNTQPLLGLLTDGQADQSEGAPNWQWKRMMDEENERVSKDEPK